MERLPISLENVPLIDAVFEIRFSGVTKLVELLPGFLFEKLNPNPEIERLPHSNIPEPLRMQDPNLMYLPVVSLKWDNYQIAIGERVLVVSSRLPYRGWADFKPTILKVVGMVNTLGIAANVERFAVKYVNVIEASDASSQISSVNLKIQVAGSPVVDDHINLRVHREWEHGVHILTFASNAQVSLMTGQQKQGIIVDVDSIQNFGNMTFADFSMDLEQKLDSLRAKNKELFFSCITEETLQRLGPVYE